LEFLKKPGGYLQGSGIFQVFQNCFCEEKAVDLVHRPWTNTRTRSKMDRGPEGGGTGHQACRRHASQQLLARGLTVRDLGAKGPHGEPILVVTGEREAPEVAHQWR
jgi:hypothetical protein